MAEHVIRGAEVDRGHHRDQAVDALGIERAVTEAEGATLADAEQVRFCVAAVLANGGDAVVDVAIDIVVQIQITVDRLGVAPIDQIHRQTALIERPDQ